MLQKYNCNHTESTASFDTPEGIKRLQQGDECTWEWVIEHYSTRLRDDILVSLNKHQLHSQSADDVVQDVWMTALKRIDSFQWQSQGKFYHWLRVIAQNHVRSLVRKNQKLSQQHPFEDTDKLDYVLYENNHFEQNIEQNWLSRERLQAIQSLLSPRDYEILMRRVVYKESVSQIAMDYGIKPQSVSVTLTRAKRTLKNLIDV